MKKLLRSLVLFGVVATSGAGMAACAYGDVVVMGDKAVIARNDQFLFGAMRKVFVCKVTAQGVTNCSTAENP